MFNLFFFFFVLWLCKKKKRGCCLNRMVIKPLGTKNVAVSLLLNCDLTSLEDGEHFYAGCVDNKRSFGDNSQKMHFSNVLWHF